MALPAFSRSTLKEALAKHCRTFLILMGYSSRIMAESWESNTLYWAALADEIGVSPTRLNVRVPEWTRKLWSRSSLRTWRTGRRC